VQAQLRTRADHQDADKTFHREIPPDMTGE